MILQCYYIFFTETPGHGSGWAETPKTDRGGDLIQDTPTPGASKRRSRWDETPGAQTPSMTPSAMTPSMTPGKPMSESLCFRIEGLFLGLSIFLSVYVYFIDFLQSNFRGKL